MVVAEQEEGARVSAGTAARPAARRRRLLPLLPVAIVAGAGAIAVLYGTRLGPWAFSDGAGYVMLARNLVAGRGLGLMRASGTFQPLSMHPPLYPLSLAALRLSGVELVTAARWLDAVLFALTIAIVGLTIYYVSRMAWLATAAAALTLVTPALVEIYTGTLSEPLFFVAGLGGLLLLLVFFDKGRWWLLVAAGIAAGMTIVTRYLGVAYAGTGLFGLLVFGARTWRRRLLEMAVYAAPVVALPAAWFAWVNAQPGADAARRWIWEFGDLWHQAEPIRGGLVAEMWTWVPFAGAIETVPYRFQLGFLATLALLLVLTASYTLRRLRTTSATDLRRLSAVQLLSLEAVFIGGYLVILSVVFLFGRPPLDAADIDQRILTPVYLAFLLSMFALVPLARQAWPDKQWVLGVPLVLTVLAVAWFAPQSWRTIQNLRVASGGYLSRSWLDSETVAVAGSLSQNIALISNESTALMFHLDRPAYDVPELLRGEPLAEPSRFGDGETGEERIFREDGAALILFDSVFWQLHSIYGDRADTRLDGLTEGLKLHADLGDGAIYFYPVGSEP